MNKIEKFFNTLNSANSKLLKRYTTDELVSQMKEFTDFTPYILKNTYSLLISKNSEDRKNGAKILKSLMFQFKLVTDFKVEFNKTEEEYYSCTGEEFVVKAVDVHEQKRIFKKLAKLEHVDNKIINDIDFKADSTIKIKKEKIKEKDIQNVNDFFDNVTNNLLSYEWNKRHGAFLAFASMFSEHFNGQIEVKVDSKLFSKIYEILRSDKFNDFVDDKTYAPVREAAAYLLQCIYPKISKNTIIEELMKFLDDDDWQTQFSGLLALSYLREFIIDKKGLCSKLEDLLVANDEDEDVKYLAADLLCYFIDYCNPQSVLEKCWNNIKGEEEIAVSKTSIITLITSIYTKYPNLKPSADDTKYVYPCFTSPIPDVRISALDMADKMSEESIDFLIAEMVLIEEKEYIRDKAIQILNKKASISENLLAHFINVISKSLYEPYSKNDFVSYDDLYFTKSGIKTIGKDNVLKNRVKLLECFIGKRGIELAGSPNTMIGDVIYKIFNKCNTIIMNNLELYNRMIEGSSSETDNAFECSNNDVCKFEDFVLFNELNDDSLVKDYERFSDLRLVPINEIRRKIANPSIDSVHPLGDPCFVDYIRILALREFFDLKHFVVAFFKYETNDTFILFFSRLILFFEVYFKKDISNFLFNAYCFLIYGFDKFSLFFKVYGDRIVSHGFFNYIMKDEKRMKFFEKTISIYSNRLDILRPIYEESLKQRNGTILTGFMKSTVYAEKFILRFFETEDLLLLNSVIASIDHSYYPVLVKPLLKMISANNQQNIASEILSLIIPTLNFQINGKISQEWRTAILEAKKSLDSLLDISKIPDYEIKCNMKIKLRSYQVEGVKWMNFLYNFNLNGILADDMGLGKTIQVLTFICSEMYKTDRKSIVVCPSSLTGHWKSEIIKFFPDFTPEIFKKNKKQTFDILIVSYETFRNEYKQLVDQDWFYIIIDEGHILRNSNTLLYSRICQFKSSRKIILTGTPVHNSIDDLISLFNFIMPNYLSLDKDVTPLNVKMNDAEMQKMHDRLQSLHKKVLPFIMRRLKVDMLKDLPPKIIRDLIVEMGPEQSKIYNEIAERVVLDDSIDYNTVKSKADGLKRTRDLLYASSHISYYKKSDELSCKVKALDDIITLCGGEEIRNKILIFFQYKSTIDFVIKDITSKYNLKYLRLDGSVPSSKRSKIAEDFNNGNVPLLFLTTQVGGLGLNLTGADTVVFYEHDWNPFNDLQAMDRAHRIGQKNTVNVFRIIAKNTLEERVMDLQSFKMFIASSLVSQQNADIETMDTKDLLERFKKTESK